jgi:hypothetical protein
MLSKKHHIIHSIFFIVFVVKGIIGFSQQKHLYDAIYSGVPWFDDKGKAVSAHGGCIVKENNKYYFFGEAHCDTSNAFAGFNCYSSTDLCNWKFENIALRIQDSGRLSAQTVGERVKVMKCPLTGEFVMFMHTDNLSYKGQCVAYAISKNIEGPYTFKGPLLFQNKPIKRWDMGTFKDVDGTGYILIHGGEIYKLSDDYKTIVEQVNKNFTSGFEAPTLFRKDSIYYFIGSDLTGWERNDNYYFTSTSLKGPWIRRSLVAPKGTLTWNSQSTFVLPVEGTKETTYMFMGDRWSFPKQASAATYVWQPLTISENNIAIPNFYEAWNVDKSTGTVNSSIIKGKKLSAKDKRIVYSGNWQQDTLSIKSSDEKGASFSFHTKATQIAVYALARSDGGYASITIINSLGKTIASSVVDFYSKYPATTLKFISPILLKDDYTIKVAVLGEHWHWQEKSGKLSGSKGNMISLDKIIVRE